MDDTMSFGDQLVLDNIEVPQANDLTKVFRVAELVAEGARTAEEISAGLDLVVREGAYYASAACAVRLVAKVEKSVGIEYELTGLGEAYVDTPPERRSRAMIRRIVDAPHVKHIAIQLSLALPLTAPVPREMLDEAAVAEALRSFPDLSLSTRERRAASLVAWMRKLNELVSAA